MEEHSRLHRQRTTRMHETVHTVHDVQLWTLARASGVQVITAGSRLHLDFGLTHGLLWQLGEAEELIEERRESDRLQHGESVRRVYLLTVKQAQLDQRQ